MALGRGVGVLYVGKEADGKAAPVAARPVDGIGVERVIDLELAHHA